MLTIYNICIIIIIVGRLSNISILSDWNIIKNISKYFDKSVDNTTIKCYNIIKDKESEADRKMVLLEK